MRIEDKIIGIYGTPYCRRAAQILSNHGYRITSIEGLVQWNVLDMYRDLNVAEGDELAELVFGDMQDARIASIGYSNTKEACRQMYMRGIINNGKDVWTNALTRAIVDELQAGGDVVIENVNTPQLKALLEELGGKLVHQAAILAAYKETPEPEEDDFEEWDDWGRHYLGHRG